MMLDFPILLIQLLSFLPLIISISMNCYSNAGLNLPSSAILYNNSTLEYCQCLMVQSTLFGFQYDSTSNSCYTFANDSSRSDLQVKINAQVCFIDRTTTTTTTSTTTTIGTTQPSPPITTSTSTSGSDYYQQEFISLSNSAPLTSLLITITVPITLGVNTPSSYTNFWANAVNDTITETNSSIVYTYQLIPGQTIVAGNWLIEGQFQLTGQTRSTSNDTYVIQILSYRNITGHF